MGIPFVSNAILEYFQEKTDQVLKCSVRDVLIQPGQTKSGPVSDLFVDFNSLFYKAYRYVAGIEPENSAMQDQFLSLAKVTLEEAIMDEVFKLVEQLYKKYQPQELMYLAIDGVAPAAKMNQQRQRRWRNAYANVHTKIQQRFDTNVFTPGTPFMMRFHESLGSWIQDFIKPNGLKIILDGHLTPGEGEHKIMRYIRKQKRGVHDHRVGLLHGMDTDLIMLSLISPYEIMYLVREDIHVALPIHALREAVHSTFGGNMEDSLRDFVLIVSIFGTDFFPRPPSVYRTEKALRVLMETRSHMDRPISSSDGSFDFRKLRSIFAAIPSTEWLQEKAGKTFRYPDPILDASSSLTIHTNELGEQERFVDDFSFRTYRNGWYSNLFATSSKFDPQFSLTDESGQPKKPTDITNMVFQVVKSYYTGIAWVFRYYTVGMDAVSQTWFYPYLHPPLLHDLVRIRLSYSNLVAHERGKTPVNPLIQLLLVLPPASKNLVASVNLRSLFDDPELQFMYQPTLKIQRFGVQKDFLGVAIIAPANVLRLESHINTLIERKKMYKDSLGETFKPYIPRIPTIYTMDEMPEKDVVQEYAEVRREKEREERKARRVEEREERKAQREKEREERKAGQETSAERQEGNLQRPLSSPSHHPGQDRKEEHVRFTLGSLTFEKGREPKRVSSVSWGPMYDETRLLNSSYVGLEEAKNLWTQKSRMDRLTDADRPLYVKIRNRLFPEDRSGARVYLNRAAYKLQQIMETVDGTTRALEARRTHEPLRWPSYRTSFLDVAGGPGAFSQFLLDQKELDPVYGFGITLESESLSWHSSLTDREAEEGHPKPFTVLWGDPESECSPGDVTCPEHIQYLRDELKDEGINWVVGDGGFGVAESSDENYQELYTFPLILGEFLLAFETLIEGGTLICKLFGSTSPLLTSLLMISRDLFEEVHLVKPQKSRTVNSEKYLVGVGYRGVHQGTPEDQKRRSGWIRLLYKVQKKMQKDPDQIPKTLVSEKILQDQPEFVQSIRDMNHYFTTTQEHAIRIVLDEMDVEMKSSSSTKSKRPRETRNTGNKKSEDRGKSKKKKESRKKRSTKSQLESYRKMKNDELKQILSERGLPVSGSKAKLIDRLLQDDVQQVPVDSLPSPESESEKKVPVPQVDYSRYTIPELKERLRLKSLPVRGVKQDLMQRLADAES